ncbi:MAG: PD-(D/E)XK nuclease family transposase, partial [Chthoniobacterales bacterium]
DIQIVLIELPKFKPTNIQDKRLTVLWLRFLKEINENTQTIDPSFLEVEEIKEALSLLEEASYNKEELEAYDKVWDAVSSEKTLLSGRYKEGRAVGREEGKAEGKAEGLAEGEAKGEAKGKAQERKAFIISMYCSGLTMDQICQIAKSTQEEVQRIIGPLSDGEAT